MQFRESIAYNHDLITDDKISIVKKKPLIAPATGIATIELFDALTNKKIFEAKTENIINNIVNKYAYMDYFYNKIKGDKGAGYYTAPFQYLLLTDYTQAENADQDFVQGNLIGWADKTTPYAGSDNSRGTINQTETKLDADGSGLLHFVFDFSTNAANGTFQTIWWAIGTGNQLINNGGPSPQAGQFGLCCDENYVYGFTYYGPLLILDKNLNTVKSVANFGQPNAGIAIDESGNKWIYPNGQQKVIRVNTFDTSDPSYQVLETVTLAACVPATSNNFAGLTVWNNKIYLQPWTMGSNPYVASRTTGASLGREGNLKVGGIYGIGKNNWFVTTAGMYDTNMNLMVPFAMDSSWLGVCYDKYTGKWYGVQTSSGNYYIKNVSFVPPGAQTLLANSVTKTPTNTMKIQYDFQVQKVL